MKNIKCKSGDLQKIGMYFSQMRHRNHVYVANISYDSG